MKTSKFEVWKDAIGEWQWHLRASNGKIIAGGLGYERRAGAVAGVKAFRRHARIADLIILD